MSGRMIEVNAEMAERINTALSKQYEMSAAVAKMREAMGNVPSIRRGLDRWSMELIGATEMEKAEAHLASEAKRVREELGLPTHAFVSPAVLLQQDGWTVPNEVAFEMPDFHEADLCRVHVWRNRATGNGWSYCDMVRGAHAS